MTGYVYMTASQKRGTIYIGVTNDLARRMPEHKSGQGAGFTSRYGVQRLVWYMRNSSTSPMPFNARSR
ncbi:excinuclease ABC subunit C [Mesorhizobium sp. LSJC277A00]|nr:excinuclease ABC subunit C [Mesorhizobium sp. LSJC277A00]